LHRCLVDAVRRRGGDPFQAPLKVSEVYQELVPYRAVRATLGVELNADYEHALLRLLAGEGGLVRLEPAAARAELQQEAKTPYPAVGLYRKFTESEVWVVSDARDEPGGDEVSDAGPAAAGRPGEDGSQAESAAPAEPFLASAPDFPEPIPVLTASSPRETAAASPAADTVVERRVVARAAECAFCDQPLPVGRRVRYCPSCGSDQRLRPCPRCDEVLERTWRFCVNCGLEVPAVPSPRPPDPDE